MMEMIVSGVISGLMGYLLPQPKWATALQILVWEWLKRKLSKQ